MAELVRLFPVRSALFATLVSVKHVKLGQLLLLLSTICYRRLDNLHESRSSGQTWPAWVKNKESC